MEILGTIIADDQIIGFGPIMRQSSKSEAQVALYGSHQFFFTVYTRYGHPIRIESNFFTNETTKTEGLKWRIKVYQSMKLMCELIKSSIPDWLQEAIDTLKEAEEK